MTRDADKCSRCFGRGSSCLCAQVRPVATRTRIIVLRHSLEWSKQSNTARIAALALTNCELRTWGGKDEASRTDDLGAPGTWLLFPEGPPRPAGAPAPQRLVVLDGSWSQARRMLHRVESLRGLPRLSLAAPAGRKSLRSAPPGGMSTLEAIARAVELLEGPEVAEPLDALHRALVGRVLKSRGYL